MGVEAGNFQLTEYSKEVIPMLNYKMEDLFCRYGVSIPYFILDFSFPDYQGRADWVTYSPPEWYLPEWKMQWPTFPTQWPDWFATNGFNFNSDWGEWGYSLPWFNELLGLLFDAADLPRWQMPDFSDESMTMLNSQFNALYEAVGQEFESQAKDGFLQKKNVWGGSENWDTDWDTSWAAMLANGPYAFTTQENVQVTFRWRYYKSSPRWYITKQRGYLSFDTSSLTGKTVTSVKLKIYPTGQYFYTHTDINIYSQTWETLDATDWAGGDLIASVDIVDFTEDEYNEIELPITCINKEGETQLKLASKVDMEDYKPEDPAITGGGEDYVGGFFFAFSSGDAAENKPLLVVTAS